MMRVDIYSDNVCPWCYLGKRRFDLAMAARPQYAVRVTLRPFELNPEIPEEGLERAAYLAAKIGNPERVAAAQAELLRQGGATGIEFRFDLLARVPNTRRSHLLIAHAARSGRQAVVQERLMRAYFQEGSDIGDVEVLVRLGVESGLTEHESRSVLVLRVGQDGVLAAERHAAVLGITGVPTFIFDGQYAVSGAQEVGTLTRILDQVADFAAARDATT